MSITVHDYFIDSSPQNTPGGYIYTYGRQGIRNGSNPAYFNVDPPTSYGGYKLMAGNGATSCGSGGVRITFPTAFTLSVYTVVVQYYDYYTDWDSTYGNSNPTPTICGVSSVDTSGFQLYQAVSVDNVVGFVPSTFGYSYIAYGY